MGDRGSRELGVAKPKHPRSPPMKVFGLQAPVYRFERARRDGLTAEQAAQAVGVPRSNLHRWAKESEPKSRRPHQVKQRSWPSAPIRAVGRLRLDFPMWGRAKARAARARRRLHSLGPGATSSTKPMTSRAPSRPQSHPRQLPAPLQPPQAAWRPCRSDPGSLPRQAQAAEIAPSHIT